MNNSVLSWLKKLAADRDVSCRSGGRLFQVAGPRQQNYETGCIDNRLKWMQIGTGVAVQYTVAIVDTNSDD